MNDNLDHLEDQFPSGDSLIVENALDELDRITKENSKLCLLGVRQIESARYDVDFLLDYIDTLSRLQDLEIARIRLMNGLDLLSDESLLEELTKLQEGNDQIRSGTAEYRRRQESAA